MEQTLNLSTNLRAVDNIKSEILSEVARLYQGLADYDSKEIYERVLGSVATIVAMDYILARRIGLEFSDVDRKISELTTIAEKNNHELEIAFSDMSELRSYIGKR